MPLAKAIGSGVVLIGWQAAYPITVYRNFDPTRRGAIKRILQIIVDVGLSNSATVYWNELVTAALFEMKPLVFYNTLNSIAVMVGFVARYDGLYWR